MGVQGGGEARIGGTAARSGVRAGRVGVCRVGPGWGQVGGGGSADEAVVEGAGVHDGLRVVVVWLLVQMDGWTDVVRRRRCPTFSVRRLLSRSFQ